MVYSLNDNNWSNIIHIMNYDIFPKLMYSYYRDLTCIDSSEENYKEDIQKL